MSTVTDDNESKTPQRSRAVFSPEDFNLIRIAIESYLEQIKGRPEAVKYSNLYHRLGRIA